MAKETGHKKLHRIFAAAMLLLLLLQLGLFLCYGARKSGFHEDEFYSYYSTNKTAGLFVNDREWQEKDSYRNDFVVLPGEQFRYDVVAKMQSWDVHPPFYYFILHTVCSLFPGVFSKWLGISVNLIAYGAGFFLLGYLVYTTVTAGKKAAGENREGTEKQAMFITFLVCMTWGFSAAVISGVMFIRMYQWLTVFILLCACLHVRAALRQDFRIRTFYLPLAVTVYLGFLTQYYYIIFHVFMGMGFCFLLLKHKKIKQLFCYGGSCAIGLLGAILSYPACLSHIFRGYRGTEAVSEFSNAGNTWERLKFFYGLFDDYVFNGTLSIWLLAVCLLLVTEGYRRKRKRLTGSREEQAGAGIRRTDDGGSRTGEMMGLLLFTCAGYFFTVSKTALLLGETSNRYQLPVYGILIFLIIYPIWSFINKLGEPGLTWRKTLKQGAALFLLGALLWMDGAALYGGRVFFLYEEEKEVMEFVKENAQTPVIVFYNDASPDNVWRLSDELMEYPRIYLASQGNEEPLTDEAVLNSDRLLVYVADYENKEECLERLLAANDGLSGYEPVAQKGLWTLYLAE